MRVALTILAAVYAASTALAQDPTAPSTVTAAARPFRGQSTVAGTVEGTQQLPLRSYVVPYSAIPERINPFAIGRGPQAGYNLCSAGTAGPTSQCQTIFINSILDFCLWGSPIANSTVADVEAAMVGYCTQPEEHGTRGFPPGTFTGLQFMRTSAYIQVTGRFNQENIGLQAGDYGGELDPYGADRAGNPLGALVYSNATDATELPYTQVMSWNMFVGSGVFCFKACFNSISSPNYCENTYDLLGCSYNAPAAYLDGAFLACEGDLQDVVGTYTDAAGAVQTWSEPAVIDPASVLPWTPRVPASSNCVTYSSAELFGAAAAVAATVPAAAAPGATSAALPGGAAADIASIVTVTSGTSTATQVAGQASATSAAGTGGSNGSRKTSVVWQVAGSVGIAAFTVWALV